MTSGPHFLFYIEIMCPTTFEQDQWEAKRLTVYMLRRREGGMGRGNWWMLASPVQVPRKGKEDMEGFF